MPHVEIRNLSKEYNSVKAIDGISFNVEKGEIFTIIGPTGAGKTTLLHLIDMLDTPTFGSIHYDGINLNLLSEQEKVAIRRRMGLVFQKPVVFKTDVYKNIAYGLNLRNIEKEVVERKVKDAIKLVGLSHIENIEKREAKSLSGGEVQKIALARTIVTEPKLLLLDEPTANLDPTNVAMLEDVIQSINYERKMTVIMATHNMFQAERLGNKVAFLFDGKLIEVGSVDAIFHEPREELTKAFIEGKLVY